MQGMAMGLCAALVPVALGCGSGSPRAPVVDGGTLKDGGTPADGGTTTDGGTTDGGNVTATTSVTISAASGGTITSDDGRLTLEFPAGALSQDTQISIRTLGEGEVRADLGNLTRLGKVYDLQPSGLTLNTPAVATLEVPVSEVPSSPAGQQPAWVLATHNAGTVEPLHEIQLDPGAPGDAVSISGALLHFSELVALGFGGLYVRSELELEAEVGQTVSVDTSVGWSDEASPSGWLAVNAKITWASFYAYGSVDVVEPSGEESYDPGFEVPVPGPTTITPKPTARCLRTGTAKLTMAMEFEIVHVTTEGSTSETFIVNLHGQMTCKEPSAACCNAGRCSTTTQAICADGGGDFKAGHACGEAGLCAGFTQACCLQNPLRCEEKSAEDCAAVGGVLPDTPKLSCLDAVCPTPNELAGYWTVGGLSLGVECTGTGRGWAFWPTAADGSKGIITTKFWTWTSIDGKYSDGSTKTFYKSLLSYLGTWQRGAPQADGYVPVQIDLCLRDYPHTPTDRLLANKDEYPCIPNETSLPGPVLWDPVAQRLAGEWTVSSVNWSVGLQQCVDSVTTEPICGVGYAPLGTSERCCTSMCSYYGVADAAGVVPPAGSPERTELVDSIQCPCGGAYLKDQLPPGG